MVEFLFNTCPFMMRQIHCLTKPTNIINSDSFYCISGFFCMHPSSAMLASHNSELSKI